MENATKILLQISEKSYLFFSITFTFCFFHFTIKKNHMVKFLFLVFQLKLLVSECKAMIKWFCIWQTYDKSSCTMRFTYLKNIHAGAFFRNEMSVLAVKLRPYKIRKIPSIADFHSLYQLLHLQVYCNGLKLWISKVKICIDNCDWLTSGSQHYTTEYLEICLKVCYFASKNLRMTQKKLCTLIQ